MSNSVTFADDKLRIQFINQKNLLSGGTVSILYTDISSLSVVKNDSKIILTLIGIASILFSFYLGFNNDSVFLLVAIGVLLLLWGLITPSNFLGVETRGGSQYWVNVKGRDIFEVIDAIEKKRSESK
jgi:hypothetical protein